jgi:hypothetical protein
VKAGFPGDKRKERVEIEREEERDERQGDGERQVDEDVRMSGAKGEARRGDRQWENWRNGRKERGRRGGRARNNGGRNNAHPR